MTASYHETLKNYFDVISQFADAQEKAANARIDVALGQIQAALKANAAEDVSDAADDPARRKVVNDLARGIAENVSASHDKKAQIHALVAKLRLKNTEMLAAHAAIVTAQQKLDYYIQMKKADEAATNELVALVGANREKLARAVTEIAQISEDIEALTQLSGKQNNDR